MPVIEFSPVLALRGSDEYEKGVRKSEECLPEKLEVGKSYPFLKHGQRTYWMNGEVPLVETNGTQTSRPIASVQIMEVTQFNDSGNISTRGLYKVLEIFQDGEIHFEGLDKVNSLSWASKIKGMFGA
jgi:hypothetical protein